VFDLLVDIEDEISNAINDEHKLKLENSVKV